MIILWICWFNKIYYLKNSKRLAHNHKMGLSDVRCRLQIKGLYICLTDGQFFSNLPNFTGYFSLYAKKNIFKVTYIQNTMLIAVEEHK